MFEKRLENDLETRIAWRFLGVRHFPKLRTRAKSQAPPAQYQSFPPTHPNHLHVIKGKNIYTYIYIYQGLFAAGGRVPIFRGLTMFRY